MNSLLFIPMYAISLSFTAGTGGALLVDKPNLNQGFVFTLGAEWRFTKYLGLEAGGLLVVEDNLHGDSDKKHFGAYVAPKYRAFFSDNIYLGIMFGPASAQHSSRLRPNTLQLMSKFGLGTEGYKGWGGELAWTHISSGHTSGNAGLDWVTLSITYSFYGE
jgi:hypothetical protein